MLHVPGEVVRVLREERPDAPVVVLELLVDRDPQLRQGQRREPRRLATDQPRGDRRIVHVSQLDARLGQDSRVEGDVVHDLDRPRVSPSSAASGAIERSRQRVDDRHPLARCDLDRADARAVREHSVRFDVEREARLCRQRAREREQLVTRVDDVRRREGFRRSPAVGGIRRRSAVAGGARHRGWSPA